MPMDRVISATSKAHKTKIIVLDACRNRISERGKSASRSLPDIGVTGGFAPISGNIGNADGMIVFYSAEPGREADDGEGAANSPFARSFAKRIVEQNEENSGYFPSRIIGRLREHQQVPASRDCGGRVDGRRHFNSAETADEAWARIRKSTDPSDFRKFIKNFPDSPLADAAQAVLDKYDLEGRLEDAKGEEGKRTKGGSAAAQNAALDQRIAEAKAAEQARLAKEKADQDAAAKALAEKQAQLAAQKQAAEDLVAEEKRKAEAATRNRLASRRRRRTRRLRPNGSPMMPRRQRSEPTRPMLREE